MSEIKERPNKQALLQDLENIRASLSDDDTEVDIPILTDTIVDDSEEEEEEERYYDEKLIFDDLDEIETLYADGEGEEAGEEELLRAAYRETLESTDVTDVLEGQQSLFGSFDEFNFDDDVNATGIRQAVKEDDVLPMARGENPFLPAHIRERLTQGKNSFLEEIALVSESLKKTASRPEKKPESGKKPEPEEKPEIIAPKTTPDTAAKKNSAENDHSKIVDELVASYLPRIEKELRTKLLQALKDKQK